MFSSDSCPLLLLIEDTAGNNCRLKAIKTVFHKPTWFVLQVCSQGYILLVPGENVWVRWKEGRLPLPRGVTGPALTEGCELSVLVSSKGRIIASYQELAAQTEKPLRKEGCKELGIGTKRQLPKDQKGMTEFSVTQTTNILFKERTFPADRAGSGRLN